MKELSRYMAKQTAILWEQYYKDHPIKFKENKKHQRKKRAKASESTKKKISISIKKYLKEHPEDKRNIKGYINHINPKTGHGWGWKGGKTPERLRARNSLDIKLWHKSILFRDKFTCQKCHTSGGKLRAHHILNFSSHPDKRNDISNGITFCEKCHIKFHSIYGIKNNTKEQLDEYCR